MADDLRELVKKERHLRKTIEGVNIFVANYKAETDADQLEVRLQRLDETFAELRSVRLKIELLIDDEELILEPVEGESDRERSKRLVQAKRQQNSENEQVLADAENDYCKVRASLLKKMPPKPEVAVSSQSQQPSTGAQSAGPSHVKLPDIKLPSYDGQLKDWITFRDTYRSLIHNNNRLSDMDKYTYLRSSLTGQAFAEIASVDYSAEFYDVAWTTLEERYEHKKLLVKALLDALFAVEPMRKESYDALNKVVSSFDRNLNMLKKVGENIDGWSTILVYMVCLRLDGNTLRHWESEHKSKEVPSYEDLMKFLRNHCLVLQSVPSSKVNVQEERRPRSTVSHAATQSTNKCPFCSEPFHSPFQCVLFLKKRVGDRWEAAKRSRLCLNCLTPGHMARTCSRGSCNHCQRRHHSLLHNNMGQERPSVPQASTRPTYQRQQQQNQQQPSTSGQQQPANQPLRQNQTPNTAQMNTHSQNTQQTSNTTQCTRPNTTTLSTSSHNHAREVLLSTALVRITDQNGNMRLVRALLDSCSQFSFMTTNCCQHLKFRCQPDYLSVQGIGGSAVVSRKVITADVSPRSPDLPQFNGLMNFYVLPDLTNTLPTQRVDISTWEFPPDAVLADPHFCEPGEVDLIIGAEHYFDLLRDGQTRIAEDGPVLKNTVFGWVVSGCVPAQSTSLPVFNSLSYSVAELHEQLAKFWDLESCRTNSTHSVEESACETLFQETTIRDSTGRFVVTLPKREFAVEKLGESRTIALKRFYGLERRFQVNLELKSAYAAFIHEYEQLGHMSLVAEEEIQPEPVYYLPHHAVLRPDSTTTKLRVVFDASCKTSTGVSLNDALMVGPVVQDDLYSIILRFRLHRVAVVADVEKMYRMVNVQSADQHLQRILWRDTPDEPVRTYKLCTVTYGTASAPYLATKCLQQLSLDEEDAYPRAAKVLRKDFYVDDMLTGVDNVEEGKQLVAEMIDLTNAGGFTLRKWNSNSKSLLADLPAHLRDERVSFELDSSSSPVKTLGLLWEPDSDCFQFHCPTHNTNPVITKHIVMSDAARLFDPLGLVGPVVVLAKIFLQSLWQMKIGLDDPLPEEMQEYWREYRTGLLALSSLTVPRWLGFSHDLVCVEILGFCDASKKAYGASLYLRTETLGGEIDCNLITAKSRVAPLHDLKRKKQEQKIPRLELSSALLLCHLYQDVIPALNIEHRAIFFTDSMIVKHWLSSLPSRWQLFIANRVSEIQHITKGCIWKHVSGIENPADIISRGMTPAQLLYKKEWYRAPLWSKLPHNLWPPEQPVGHIDPTLLEEKVVALVAVVQPNRIFTLYSSLFDLIRRVALARRFVQNCLSHPEDRKTGMLSHADHEATLLGLVRWAQHESLPDEIRSLEREEELNASSRILSLHPVLVDGILRVGGRLSQAAVAANRKHPIILCHRHPFTKLIMLHYHIKLFHAGQQLLVASVREKYWPTRIRSLANSVTHECVACFRAKPKVMDQLMADLPSERVQPALPFLKVGVDYCGPFQIKFPVRRSNPRQCFVAVFVCLVTKAVHLEIVGDLTSGAFLAAFKRFVSRRGKPQLVKCDNATNFVGGRRELDELRRLFLDEHFQQSVIRGAEEEDTEFSFIPPRTPNFGGLWEAAVKSFKFHFKRTIGLRVLECDEMLTVVTQIEAILNSRPLTPISNDPADFEALTPGHFLIQRPLTAVPEPFLQHLPENRLSVWQRAQNYVQQIWKKWSTQYLSELHNRTKWTRQRNNIREGTMVVVVQDNIPPLKWPLARVIKVYRGTDGNVRVVTVKTPNGRYDRGISRICVLPIADNLPNNASEENESPAN